MRTRKLSFILAFAALWLYACSTSQPAPDYRTPSESEEETSQAPSRGVQESNIPKLSLEHDTFVLDNGLTVVVHTDRKAPVVAVNVWYHVGSKDEPNGKTGFAHLFEHLMFQGSENFVGEFFAPLEDAGATDMNGTTSRDRTNYFQTVPKSSLDVALWMEAERMGHFQGAISQERLDEQRGVVKNEKRQGLNRPYGIARMLIPKYTYPHGHPYSWPVIGSMEDLDAASLEDVKTWFETYYGASNAVLVLAGDITVEEAREKVEAHFGHIQAGPAVDQRGVWVARMKERVEHTAFDQVPQERVYQVFNLPQFGSDEAEYLRLASLVLGSGKNSRLYRRLVYEDQLATNVYVWFSDGEIGSQLYVVADARPDVALSAVEGALEEELDRFTREGPKAEELDRVRTTYFANRMVDLEKVGGFGGKANMLAKHRTFLDDAGAFDARFETLRSATVEDVRKASEAWIGDSKFVLRILPKPAFKASNSESKVDRSGVPAMAEAPSLDLPDLERATLSNGIEVVLAPRSDVPVVRVQVLARRGYAGETAKKAGLATLALDVLDEGTQDLNSLELAEELDRLGASISTTAALENTRVSLRTLSTTFEPSLRLLAELVRNPAYDAEELERRRKQHLAQIAQEKSQPFSMALRLLGPLLFATDHAYSVPLTGSGYEASVSKFTRDDLVEFHRTTFVPANITFLATGDIDLEDLTKSLEARFGDWEAPHEPGELMTGETEVDSARKIYLVDKPGAAQSLIVAGNRFPDRQTVDPISAEVMNAVIGGAFTSRINMNLREEKHWSYGARSFIYETLGTQLFGVYANVQSDKTGESILEIERELREYVTTRPIEKAELDRTVQNKTRKIPGQNETTDALLSNVRTIVHYGLEDNYYDTYVEKMAQLTPENVTAAARGAVQPDQLTYIVIGDLSKIEESVRALELGEVVILDPESQVTP